MPTGIVSTGWSRVESFWSRHGVAFDPWQQGVGKIALGKRRSGKYAATVGGIVMSIPRQVGKTFIVGAIIIALCCTFRNLTVLWTSHHLRTTSRTFEGLQGLVKRRSIAPLVKSIRTANGEAQIEFTNGSAILFGARSQGFGRGFTEIDIEVFDEAQILTARAVDDMVPATNQTRQPAGALLFFIGTPPAPTDPSEDFTRKRQKALSGKTRDMVYVEFSADPDASLDDPEQIAKANPSFPHRTDQDAIDRMREHLDEAALYREMLGIWAPESSRRVIPANVWDTATDKRSSAVARLALGVEVAPDYERTSVCLAGQRADGSWHVELDERRDGYEWSPAYIADLLAKNPGIVGVALDERSPSAVLVPLLRDVGVRVMSPQTRELGQAHSALLEGLVTGQVWHTGQVQMNVAASVVTKKKQGDTGLWVFARTSATADPTPMQGSVLALWVAQHDKPKSPRRRTSGRRVVTF